MELAGHILLGMVGILMVVICVIGICRSNFAIDAQHVTVFIVSVGCIVLAFFPVSKFSMGISGISAELDRQKKTIDTMKTVIESSANEDQKRVLSAIFDGGGKWTAVANIPSSGPGASPSDIKTNDLIKRLSDKGLLETRCDGGSLNIRSR